MENFRETLDSVNIHSFQDDNDRREALAAAHALCQRLERPMDTMLRIAWVEPAFSAVMKIAMDLSLFHAVAGRESQGPRPLDDLATETGSDPELLVRILRFLAAGGALVENAPGLYSPNDLTKALLKPDVGSAIGFRHDLNNVGFQHFPQFLADTGYRNPKDIAASPWQAALGTDQKFFDWLVQQPKLFETFSNHMIGYTSQRGTWDSIYPIDKGLQLSERPVEKDILLVDVGGGSGHDLRRFGDRFAPKDARLVLQDLPEVIEMAKSSALPAHIEAVPLDFIKESPVSGARGYYFHSIFECWPNKEALEILQNLRPVLAQKTKDGLTPKLLLNENVVPEVGTTARMASLDFIMCIAFAGGERTEAQWRQLLETAGYKILSIYSDPKAADESLIEAIVDG